MRLDFEDVSLAFGPESVIRDLRQTVEFSRTLALIGPSGGGKSSLLRLLGGLLRPTAGSIRIDGVPIPENSDALRAYRSRIGTVFQTYNLFPHLDALANVSLPLTAVHGWTATDASQRARDILGRFRLTDHLHKRPATLSGGQRQRVALARALAIEPRFLLLDEPTSALDPEMKSEVLDLVAELCSEGRPIILATHEMAFARQSADWVAFVSEGTILALEPAETFFASPPTREIALFLERSLRY